MSVYTQLMKVQVELKVPKSQYNSFGKYKYRNAEDIQEAVKPLEAKYNVALFLSDEPVMVGEWHYIKSTATFVDLETDKEVVAFGYAREEETKKGMDASQITGSTSSYARKYALCGLFLLDDTKDADADEPKKQEPQKEPKAAQYVKVVQGTTCILNNKGAYVPINRLKVEHLEKLLALPAYEAAHAAITKLLAEVKHE